jgi:DNA polymerase (family 10)
MDSRTAAHVLTRIAGLLELNGENKFKSRAYRTAAKALLALDTDDLAPLLRSGELEATTGLGPVTVSATSSRRATRSFSSDCRKTRPRG